MCFIRKTIAYLCLNMINFDAVDFSECRSEEVMFHLMLCVLHKLHFTKKFTQLVLISNCNGHYVLHFVQACQQLRGGGSAGSNTPPPPHWCPLWWFKGLLGLFVCFYYLSVCNGKKNPLSGELKGRKDLFPLFFNFSYVACQPNFYYRKFHSLEFWTAQKIIVVGLL